MSYLARPIGNRGVHLRISPRPSNLGETREILRLLSQFGEIDYFKNLKYDGHGLGLPNIGLVIYKDEEGAKNCFRGSPVRFRMGKVKASPKVQEEEPTREQQGEEDHGGVRSRGGAWGLGEHSTTRGLMGTSFGLEADQPRQRRYASTSSTASLPRPTPRPIRMPFDSPSPPDTAAEKHESEERIFQIHTSSTNRNFRDQINMGAYHGRFAIDSKMIGQEDLAKKVPVLGMSCLDWRARGRPWRLVKADQEGKGRRERLGVLWEREGKAKAEEKERSAAFGEVEMGPKKWGMSWADIGIK